jgi:hypothetical protein
MSIDLSLLSLGTVAAVLTARLRHLPSDLDRVTAGIGAAPGDGGRP